MEQKFDEKKKAAASYIMTFYNGVISLNQTYALYLNSLIELEREYGGKISYDDMEQTHQQVLLNSVQNTRYAVQTLYIQLETIKSQLTENKDTKSKDKKEEYDYEADFKTIRDDFFISREVLLKFTIHLNKFLTQDIIKKLITDSQQIMDEMYD